MAGETNVQGEKVKKLDVIANQLMINMLQSSYTTCVMVSEENEAEIEVDIERQVINLLCTAAMQARTSYDKAICLYICPSVRHTHVL